MPGLTASITVYTLEKDNILTIPDKALRFTPDQELMQAYFAEQMKKQGKSEEFNPSDGKKEWKNHPMQNEDQSKDENIKTVWIKEGDIVHPKRITIGITDGTSTEVVEGLSENEQVLTGMSAEKSVTTKKTRTSQTRSPFLPRPPKH